MAQPVPKRHDVQPGQRVCVMPVAMVLQFRQSVKESGVCRAANAQAEEEVPEGKIRSCWCSAAGVERC